MADEVLVGIDVGTNVLKVAAFDGERGAMLARASRQIPVEIGSDGRRETDLGDLDRVFDDALASVRSVLGDRWSAVSGIGLATQGGSTIVCDRQSGDAVTPMALWNDARCFALHSLIEAARPVEYWRSFSLRDEPGMGLARLRWIAATRPQLLTESHLYAGVGEYICKRLTGVWRQDACNAAQIGIYDAVRDRLTADPLADSGLDLSFFAPLRRGHELNPLAAEGAARLGLMAGLPVAGPYNDHEAGYASIADDGQRPLLASLGTAWVGSFGVTPDHGARSPFGFVLPSPTGAGRLVLQPLLTGNVTWDWALRQFVAENPAEALTCYDAVFAERLLPLRGLVAVPWLNRPNPLQPAAIGGAAILGIGPSSDRADLLRAVAAGMCCELHRVLEPAAAHGAIDAVVLAGGASKGRHFRRIISALFDPLPVRHVVEDEWMGARGALAAFQSPAAHMGATEPNDGPPPDRPAVSELVTTYAEAHGRLYGHVGAGEPVTIDAR